MFRMVQVTVIYELILVDPAPLESMAGQLAKEWVRPCFNCWLFWTDKSNVTIAEMMRTKLNAADQLFVVGLAMSEPAHGFANQWIWDWWNTKRDTVTGEKVGPVDWVALLGSIGEKN